MRGLAVICVLAGCSFSTTTGGDPAVGDASVPLDVSADDVDGDGVKNAVDNCPMVANAGQYNEDGDGKGDECDPCPHLGTPAADGDGDGDGVGDGCDPHPSVAGDVLAYWNGFHVAASEVAGGITMSHGAVARWSIANGALEFDRTTDDWGMPIVDVGKVNHTIDTGFDMTAIYSGTASAAGVAVDVSANDTDNFLCQARTDTQRREMWRRNPGASDGWSAVTSVAANTPMDSYRIVFHRTATDLRCVTTRMNQISVEVTDTTDSVGNTRAGVFARNVDVRFRYMAVYTSP